MKPGLDIHWEPVLQGLGGSGEGLTGLWNSEAVCCSVSSGQGQAGVCLFWNAPCLCVCAGGPPVYIRQSPGSASSWACAVSWGSRLPFLCLVYFEWVMCPFLISISAVPGGMWLFDKMLKVFSPCCQRGEVYILTTGLASHSLEITSPWPWACSLQLTWLFQGYFFSFLFKKIYWGEHWWITKFQV